MNTAHPGPAYFILSVLSLLAIHANVDSSGNTRQDARQDSIKSRVGTIAKPNREPKTKLLPRFNPKKDSAGFQYIPKSFEPEVHVVSEIAIVPSDFVPYQRPPRLLTTVEPVYPEAALAARLEGSVFVRILVGTSGKVDSVIVVKSDADVFNGPAVRAVKQFVFTPAYLNNTPVKAAITREIHFRFPGK